MCSVVGDESAYVAYSGWLVVTVLHMHSFSSLKSKREKNLKAHHFTTQTIFFSKFRTHFLFICAQYIEFAE
jgi:hypothetical protein